VDVFQGRLIDFAVHLGYSALVSHGSGMVMPSRIGPKVLRRRTTLPTLLALSLCCMLVPPISETLHDEELPHAQETKHASPGSGWILTMRTPQADLLLRLVCTQVCQQNVGVSFSVLHQRDGEPVSGQLEWVDLIGIL
jgi:hypothetical protein